MKVSRAQLLSLVRHALGAAGGALAAQGYLDEAAAQEAVGALMTLVAVALGMYDKTGR